MPNIDRQLLRRFLTLLRERYQTDPTPYPICSEEIIRALGAELIDLGHDTLGWKPALHRYSPQDDKHIIEVNREIPLEWKNFVLMHELHHMITNCSVYSPFDPEVIYKDSSIREYTLSAKHEAAANHFASVVLCPEPLALHRMTQTNIYDLSREFKVPPVWLFIWLLNRIPRETILFNIQNRLSLTKSSVYVKMGPFVRSEISRQRTLSDEPTVNAHWIELRSNNWKTIFEMPISYFEPIVAYFGDKLKKSFSLYALDQKPTCLMDHIEEKDSKVLAFIDRGTHDIAEISFDLDHALFYFFLPPHGRYIILIHDPLKQYATSWHEGTNCVLLREDFPPGFLENAVDFWKRNYCWRISRIGLTDGCDL